MIYPPPDENPDSFAESNPYLTVDTSLFPASFQTALLAALSNDHDLDEATDGLLIHSDNFQALNLLQARYRGQVKCIYIDPPYNTEKDRAEGKFIYKDGYPSSTWASLIHSRLLLAKPLLNQSGTIFQSIDDNEHAKLKIISDDVFGSKNHLSSFIRKTKSMTGDDGNGLNIQHEYYIVHGIDKNNIIFSGEEKNLDDYSNPDNDPNGNWCSGDPSAKSGGSSTYFPIKNPYTGMEDYPPKGRFWAFSQETMEEYIKSGRIKFKEKYNPKHRGFIFKRYAEKLTSNSHAVGTLFSAENDFMNSVATAELNHLTNYSKDFDYPKPSFFIQKIIQYLNDNNSLILDYFAGSGTTAHAVINLNREDGGRRKYILVEQGEYFDTVLKPRVQKVVYAENWKDGKPQADKESSLHGVPQIVKVLKLESYEDTLNNLVLKDNGDLFNQLNDGVKEDYLLRYMLTDQSRDSLLNTDVFRRPFNYQMDIATNSAGATERMDIDLVETFNYLLGLRVHAVKDRFEKDGYLAVEGTLPDGETSLVLWRDCEKMGYEGLDALLGRLKINPQDSEYDTVYINGDHNITTVWENENGVSGSLKVRQIESEFSALMFGEAQ